MTDRFRIAGDFDYPIVSASFAAHNLVAADVSRVIRGVESIDHLHAIYSAQARFMIGAYAKASNQKPPTGPEMETALRFMFETHQYEKEFFDEMSPDPSVNLQVLVPYAPSTNAMYRAMTHYRTPLYMSFGLSRELGDDIIMASHTNIWITPRSQSMDIDVSPNNLQAQKATTEYNIYDTTGVYQHFDGRTRCSNVAQSFGAVLLNQNP